MVGSFHVIVDALVIVGLSVGVSLLVLWLARRLVPHDRLTPHNEVSGFVYAVIGVVYAVILGFVVISVWDEYRDAETNARQEADALADLYRIAEGLPEPARQALQDGVMGYATAVIEVEWPAMHDGTAPSQEAVDQTNAIWAALYEVDVTTPVEVALYASALEQVTDLSTHRRERLEDAEAELLTVIWAVVIGGGVLTVLFPCLFGVENGLVHALIITTLAAAIGLLLLVVYELNHPFAGDVHTQPEGLEMVLEQISARER
jgi:Protein of unknown function (DUF4239)